MAEVHQLIMAHGKEVALQSDVDRAVVEAAAGYMSAEDNDIGYLFSGWAQAGLPHRRLPDDVPWQVSTDRVTLIVQPGLRPMPGGNPVSVGVPYGSRARLILLYLQTEAVRAAITARSSWDDRFMLGYEGSKYRLAANRWRPCAIRRNGYRDAGFPSPLGRETGRA